MCLVKPRRFFIPVIFFEFDDDVQTFQIARTVCEWSYRRSTKKIILTSTDKRWGSSNNVINQIGISMLSTTRILLIDVILGATLPRRADSGVPSAVFLFPGKAIRP